MASNTSTTEAVEYAIKVLGDCRKVFSADGGDDIWQISLRKAIAGLTAAGGSLGEGQNSQHENQQQEN